MDHDDLDIFCTVVDEASVTRAARRLGRAQSNVTTRLQQLESLLGVALFAREGKRLRLLPEGETFLVYARRLLALAEEARQALRADAPCGVLRVGAMESTAASRLPPVFAAFHREWPTVQLRFVTGPSQPLMEQVQRCTLDCALLALDIEDDVSEVSLRAAGLCGEPVFDERLVWALPRSHRPVRTAADLRVSSLAAFREGCAYRAMALRWLSEDTAAAPLVIQEVASYHMMLACVAAGLSVALVPRSVIAMMPDTHAVRQKPLARVRTWVVWRNAYSTPALTALRDALRAGRRGSRNAAMSRDERSRGSA